MQIYWSLKQLPELQGRSRKELYQVQAQVGLKPYRHLQVWLATALLILLILLCGDILMAYVFQPLGIIDLILRIGFVSPLLILGAVIYSHTYLKALPRYIQQVSFETPLSGARIFFNMFASFVFGCILAIVGVFGFLVTINCYDESPDPRIAELKNCPEPIPDKDNGFVAMTGMAAPIGSNPFEVGKAWIEANNEVVRKHGDNRNNPVIAGLEYFPYASEGSYRVFCSPGEQSCWNRWEHEQTKVRIWLASNGEWLSRYQSLQGYPRWQNSLLHDSLSSVPAYITRLQGHSLLQASAMLNIADGHVERGLRMIGEDIRFARRILIGRDDLTGTMIAVTILSRDLALLADTTQHFPQEIKPYLGEIETMLEPLTATELSLTDAYRYEEQLPVSELDWQDSLKQTVSEIYKDEQVDLFERFWNIAHIINLARYATLNLYIEDLESQIMRYEVSDPNLTYPVTDSERSYQYGWFGTVHNAAGKAIFLEGSSVTADYRNRMADLNAANRLLRLQVLIAAKNLQKSEVQAFLKNADQTLQNPETGKPFKWDDTQTQIYFFPSSEWFKKNFFIGGVPGRVGISVM